TQSGGLGLYQRVQQRDIDALPLACQRTRVDRSERAGADEHRGQRVDERHGHANGCTVWLAVQGEEAGVALDEEVDAGPVSVRTSGAECGHADPDDVLPVA